MEQGLFHAEADMSSHRMGLILYDGMQAVRCYQYFREIALFAALLKKEESSLSGAEA